MKDHHAQKNGYPYSYDFSGKRILVASNELQNRSRLESVIRSTGADVILAQNGKKALYMLETACTYETMIDMAFIDTSLNELNGIELIAKIRSSEIYIPIVARLVEDDSSDRCMTAGCTEYIRESYSGNDILDILKQYLKK
jgi:CheY-like chemotaxis protein